MALDCLQLTSARVEGDTHTPHEISANDAEVESVIEYNRISISPWYGTVWVWNCGTVQDSVA
jgi:hypothetical protein